MPLFSALVELQCLTARALDLWGIQTGAPKALMDRKGGASS